MVSFMLCLKIGSWELGGTLTPAEMPGWSCWEMQSHQLVVFLDTARKDTGNGVLSSL
jgi:hypothetical protein